MTTAARQVEAWKTVGELGHVEGDTMETTNGRDLPGGAQPARLVLAPGLSFLDVQCGFHCFLKRPDLKVGAYGSY